MEMKKVIEDSFISYAGAVLQSRALVDARDCLKPSARQLFYCMETDNFVHSKPFKKTLKAIGSGMRLYIHGDSSAEGVIMRAGQPFAMRYPLVEVEGSYGNLMESGNWAAPRYTSSRLSALSDYFFQDLKKDTIEDWRDNYDDTEKYPSVLPSKGFYNIVNGTSGIGVGAASSIPAFNLKEVNDALIKLLWNPDIDINELICMPDFSTGAMLLNKSEVIESLKNGKGKACKLRSRISFDEKDRVLTVTEIPYGVYTNTICGQLEEILESEDNPGIERFNDLTGATPLIKIYLTKTASPAKVLKYLYKNTSLQYFYTINMVMLENGKFPKLYNWKTALQSYLNHEKIIYTNAFNYDLRKIERRLEIIEGLLICIENINEVVNLIKMSKSTSDATAQLRLEYGLTPVQAEEVLKIRLSRLAQLEVQKLINEKNELLKEKARIEEILSDETLLKKEIERDLTEVARKYGDPRRTEILDIENEDQSIVEKKDLLLYLTNTGYLWLDEVSNLYSQNRNSVGHKFKLEKDEYNIGTFKVLSNDKILLFSNLGNYYSYNVSELDIKKKTYLGSLVPLKDNEIITQVIPLSSEKKKIAFFTKNGYLKKSKLEEYENVRRSGAAALSLYEGDKVVAILPVEDDDSIGILTKNGNFLIINIVEVRDIGRIGKGVKAIKLDDGNEVVSVKKIPLSTKEIVSVTQEGLIKRTNFTDFVQGNRGTKGSKIQKLRPNDYIADFESIQNEDSLLIVTTGAQLKIRKNDISLLSRDAQGVLSIKKKPNEKVLKIFTL